MGKTKPVKEVNPLPVRDPKTGRFMKPSSVLIEKDREEELMMIKFKDGTSAREKGSQTEKKIKSEKPVSQSSQSAFDAMEAAFLKAKNIPLGKTGGSFSLEDLQKPGMTKSLERIQRDNRNVHKAVEDVQGANAIVSYANLIQDVSIRCGTSKRDTESVITSVFDVIADYLRADIQVEIKDFGRFLVVEKDKLETEGWRETKRICAFRPVKSLNRSLN